MRITLVTETFPPEVNGAAGSLHRLVAGLSARGHRLVVVRPRFPMAGVEYAPPPDWEEWPVASVPLPGYSALRVGLPAGRKLVRRWRADRPDVVHVATEGPLGWSAVIAARRLGIPVSSSFHTNFHSFAAHYRAAPLRRAALCYLRTLHNLTRRTLVPSVTVREELDRAGFRNLGILGRGVDTDLFGPVRRDSHLRRVWGAGPETPVVIHVGRLASEKNPGLLVDSFEAMRRLHRPAPRLVLVGDGPARRRLEREHPFCGLPPYVVCERLIGAPSNVAGDPGPHNGCGVYNARRKAMSPASSRQRFAGLSSCTSQSASALAFISRSTSA